MRKLSLVVITALALCATSLPAGAESGVARGVKPQASAEGGGSVRTLVVGADVSIGEIVKTGSSGTVQLLFRDKTELVIGPNSSLLIEDYLIRDDGSPGKFAISALSGTFRFATGSAGRDKYVIKTPTGTIGIRGTAFDFSIANAVPDFIPRAPVTTTLLLYQGKVRLCNLARRCVDVVSICDFGAFNSAGAVAVENEQETRVALRNLFPFALNQSGLLSLFRVSNARECVAPTLVAPGGTPSSVTGGNPLPETTTPPPETPTPPPETPTPPPTTRTPPPSGPQII